jgi:hypothetical protein
VVVIYFVELEFRSNSILRTGSGPHTGIAMATGYGQTPGFFDVPGSLWLDKQVFLTYENLFDGRPGFLIAIWLRINRFFLRTKTFLTDDRFFDVPRFLNHHDL